MNILLNFILVLLFRIYAGVPLLDKVSKELCPIIGYHGAFCPSVTTEFHSLKQTTQVLVSNGVGMALDLSTGEIKLPALQFTYKKKSMVPTEVMITIMNRTENSQPNVHIFRTEQDSIKVWEHNNGSWLGGTFGHTKDVLYIYENFFMGNQATAILQHLYPLYILTIKSENITHQLNTYAEQAINKLPTKYDAQSYIDFMNTWGTHIAVKTELGGMREQQILFKNCIWHSNYFTGGLTDAELKLQLTEELLSSTPLTNRYYKERRKIMLDRRIGGNTNVSDLEQWLQTLSANPALLKISEYIPWFDVVQNSVVKTNLKNSIIDRITSAAAARTANTNQVEQQKLAARFSQRSAQAVVGHGPRGAMPASWEIGNLITLNDAQKCPEGLPVNQSKENCNTGTFITSWNTIELTEPLRYERDVTTGNFRSIRIRDIVNGQNIERAGPWIESGCSLLPTTWSNMNNPPPASTVIGMVCSGCAPSTRGSNREIFSCDCPSY